MHSHALLSRRSHTAPSRRPRPLPCCRPRAVPCNPTPPHATLCRATPDEVSDSEGGDVGEVLMEMVSRSLDEKGVSWRVGVSRPMDPLKDMPRPGSIASLLMTKHTVKAAVSNLLLTV